MQNYSTCMLNGGARSPLTARPTEAGIPLSVPRKAGFLRQNPRGAGLLSALLLGLLLILCAQADPLDCWTRTHQSRELYRVMFTDGLWIAVGYDEILTSGDGLHWTNRFVPANEAENLLLLALARGNGVFAAAGVLYANGTLSGSNSVATSADGLTWTRHDVSAPSEFLGMAYGNGTFVAVGERITDFITGIGGSATDIGQLCICGGLPELRSMTAPLMERFDVEVEPLDSLFGIDAGRLPQPVEEFRERGAELRLAWAVASDWPSP